MSMTILTSIQNIPNVVTQSRNIFPRWHRNTSFGVFSVPSPCLPAPPTTFNHPLELTSVIPMLISDALNAFSTNTCFNNI